MPSSQSDEIVHWDAPPAEGSRSQAERHRVPRLLLAAAAFLLVASIAGGLAMANRNEDDAVLVTAGPGTSLPARSDAALAEAFWGDRYEVSAVVEGGRERALLPDPAGLAVVVDARVKGELVVSGCNAQSGPSHIQGGRLMAEPDSWAGDHEICLTSQLLLGQDRWFEEFFQGSPSLDVGGDRATLRVGEEVVSLVRERAPGRGTSSATVPSDQFSASCAVGFDLGNGVNGALLRPGPADPPLGRVVSDAWHLEQDGQTVEIHIPATGVVPATGSASVAGPQNGAAQLWFERGTVHVLWAVPPYVALPCGSYDLIVAGPNPEANQSLATALASDLRMGVP